MFILLLSGCSTQSSRKHTYSNSLHRAVDVAARDPLTWAPVLAAAVLSVGSTDEKISNSLSKHNPVFSSQDNAEIRSDDLKLIIKTGAIASTLFTPEDNPSTNIVGDLFALTTVDKTTAIIKQSTNRTRPDGSDNESFPSGHTSQAFSAARIISDNLQYYNFSDEAQTNIRYGAYAFATGTAWARVEAKKHHPTDVLIGAALGNFMTIFFNELFKGNENVKAKVEVDTVENEVQLGVNWRF